MDTNSTIIIIFFITAIWDLILQGLSLKYISFFGVEKMKWVTVLKKYFDRHTSLGAAVLAGITGSATAALVLYTYPLVLKRFPNVNYLIYIAVISGIVGIPMRYLGLFPHLKKYYYDELGFIYSFITDTLSGVIVALTFYLFLKVYARFFKQYDRKYKEMNHDNIGFDFDGVMHTENLIPFKPIHNKFKTFKEEGKKVFIITHNKKWKEDGTIKRFIEKHLGYYKVCYLFVWIDL